MTPLRKTLVVLAAAAGSGLCAANGLAQTLTPPVQRPMQGLFGRARNAEGLDMSLLTFEGYDDDRLGDGGGLLDPRMQKSGPYNGLDAAVTVKHKFHRVSFEGAEQSEVRYYPSLADLVGVRHTGTLGVAAQFDRTRVNVTQMVGYAPYYSYTTLPQLFDPQASDVAVAMEQVLTRRPALVTETAGAFSQTFGRVSMALSGRTQRTAYVEEARNGLRADSASARLTYHVTRDLGLVGGYGLQRGQYDFDSPAARTVQFNNIELGVDYDHALSLTRRTTIGFATGTTVVRDLRGAPEYRLIGDVRFSREIGRTWHATGSYHRGAGLVAGLGQPVFSDAVRVGLIGSLSPRLMLWTSAGFSNGELTAVTQQNRTSNYTGSARLQYALTRIVALTGEYDYYQYHFDRLDGLPAGLGQNLARHSARIGLTLWLPLYR